MPNAASLSAIAKGALIQTVDDGRDPKDNLKLPGFLRTVFDAPLAALEKADNATALTESDRTGGSEKARGALTAMEEMLRQAFYAIKGLPATILAPSDKLALFAAYGWVGGKIGKFSDARVLGLTRLALDPDTQAAVPKGAGYHPDIMTGLAAQLAIYNANHMEAMTGDRKQATETRDDALSAFQRLIARARFYYCCATDDTDQTAELAKIGMQARRDPTPSKKNSNASKSSTPAPPSGGSTSGSGSSTPKV